MDEKGFPIGITGQEKVVIPTQNNQDGHTGGSKHCKLNLLSFILPHTLIKVTDGN